MSDKRHDPTYTQARGRWVHCTCGWSHGARTATAVQLAFGEHLLADRSVSGNPEEPQEDG